MNVQELLERMDELISTNQPDAVVETVKLGLDEGIDPVDVFEKCLVPVLDRVGERFSRMEVFLPDLMMAADVAKRIKNLIEPVIRSDAKNTTSKGTIVLGSVKGDIHDIGKNMVSVLLEVNGFKVIDLGTDVPVFDFIQAADRENADVIAMSSLLTTSMPYMAELVETLEELGKRNKYKVVIGGGPVSEDYADKIRADAYGKDARVAVEICRSLVKGV